MIVREATAADATGIARVHVDSWRSTYRGIVSDEVLDGLSYEGREAMWTTALTTQQASNHIYVVEGNDGEVIGFAAAGMEREQQTGAVGEIYAIYLLEKYQGLGLGKQLFLQTARRLAQEGYSSMMLWVLAENPTQGFYEAMGGTATNRKGIEIGADTLVEVAYEWPRLDEITG